MCKTLSVYIYFDILRSLQFNPLNAKLNSICYLLALLGAHHFLHVSRIRVKRNRRKFLKTIINCKDFMSRSRWPCGLRLRTAAACC